MKEKSAKLADVARVAEVSQGTASNVFNRPEVVREQVREHVLKVAAALGYRGPDVKGRLLRAGRVNAIGVATVEPLSYFFEDPWARALMTAIGDVCDESGTGIALVSAKNQEKLAWNVNSALVDGFILLCVEGGERLVDLTRRRQLPFIALALGEDDASVPRIGIDNRAGAAAAARHLGELGHRNVAILAIGNHDVPHGLLPLSRIDEVLGGSMRERMRGYWQGMETFGIGPEDMPVFGTLNDQPTVEAAMTALFSMPAPPTAVLAMSDHSAMLALQWLAARGIAVPGEVSVVGFDGVPEAALSQPALTTVVQPLPEIARRAVASILDATMPADGDVMAVELVVRKSTAAPGR